MKKYYKKALKKNPVLFLLLFLVGITILYFFPTEEQNHPISSTEKESKVSYSIENIPNYEGEAYVVLNKNIPNFDDQDKKLIGESYSDLDQLGRCGVAFARVGRETMPTEKRGSIGMIKPSGWHTIKFDFVDGKYLYNRCHLIAHQLTGQNANPKNLMTCTRSMNVDGMLPFENKVANYIKETNNHVLYRVTPVFDGDNLIANGAYMEAYSVEDNGKLSFNVYVYNVQKGVTIDYKTGEAKLSEE